LSESAWTPTGTVRVRPGLLGLAVFEVEDRRWTWRVGDMGSIQERRWRRPRRGEIDHRRLWLTPTDTTDTIAPTPEPPHGSG